MNVPTKGKIVMQHVTHVSRTPIIAIEKRITIITEKCTKCETTRPANKSKRKTCQGMRASARECVPVVDRRGAAQISNGNAAAVQLDFANWVAWAICLGQRQTVYLVSPSCAAG